MKIVDVDHLSFEYGNRRVLHNLNFSIRQGDYAVLTGENGSGKSTLMKVLSGELESAKGRVVIAGSDSLTAALHRIRIGYMPQNGTSRNAFFPATVEEIMETGMYHPFWKKWAVKDKKERICRTLEEMGMKDALNRRIGELSGGQQQRVAIARAIVNEPEVLLLDEPLAALDLKMRKDMQMELKEMHKSLGITFVYVTHDQEEALTLSDTIVVMSEGKIQQIGTPIDIYNEPVNSFVADFIGESNILNGTMIKDRQVSFAGHEFECVDEGFGEQMPVDVVLRPEDIYIFEPSEAAMLTGTVTSSIFKGVHYEMMVQTPNGYEFMVQDYHPFEAGSEVGLLIKPFDIHVMKKERICNTFEGKLIDATHVEFLGCTFECKEVTDIEPNTPVKVEIDFKDVILEDNEEDGRLTGEVKFILYKGNHYHLTVFTDWDEDIFVDTNDVWDDGDHVGITIAPDKIRIIHA